MTTDVTSNARPVVEIDSVSKRFGQQIVLDGVSLDVPHGGVTAIIGPSGSGKSTLLRSINHLEKVDQGLVRVDGDLVGYRQSGNKLHELSEREVRRQRSRIGFVFQDFNLFPHLSVLDNIIEAPLSAQRRQRAEVETLAHKLLERVGLGDRAGAYPRQLSGGQQQRVAIARALALRPAVLLLDEPTSALDPELVGEVLGVIRDLAGEGVAMVVVTHEVAFAREVADTVVFLDQGRVIESGAAARVIDEPAQERTRSFLRRVL